MLSGRFRQEECWFLPDRSHFQLVSPPCWRFQGSEYDSSADSDPATLAVVLLLARFLPPSLSQFSLPGQAHPAAPAQRQTGPSVPCFAVRTSFSQLKLDVLALTASKAVRLGGRRRFARCFFSKLLSFRGTWPCSNVPYSLLLLTREHMRRQVALMGDQTPEEKTGRQRITTVHATFKAPVRTNWRSPVSADRSITH